MKIFYSPYTLISLAPLNAQSAGKPREGVLLKVAWPDGRVGYADLHPWPELGDLPLEQQLANLREGKMSLQIEQSIWLANRDAGLRRYKKNFFDGASKIRNNYVIANSQLFSFGDLDQLKSDGFSCLKIKVGRDLESEMALIMRATSKDFMLRLDFNGIGNWQVFERFISKLDKLTLSHIEYVEDPFPYDENAWSDARQLVRIALDNQAHKVRWGQMQKAPFDVLVIKPAKVDVDQAMGYCKQFGLKATVTSYMDHPVGMIHALTVAMELKKNHNSMMNDPGCYTHHLYKMDAFSAALSTQGPYVLKVPGTGVGFDSLLEGSTWYQLKMT